MPFSELSDLMCRAKVVWWPYSGFAQGSHEPVLTAMGCGAVALTFPTSFFKEHFLHGTHPAYFSTCDEAVSVGRQIFEGSRWKEVGRNGQEIIQLEHSWTQRGKELVPILQKQIDQKKDLRVSPTREVMA